MAVRHQATASRFEQGCADLSSQARDRVADGLTQLENPAARLTLRSRYTARALPIDAIRGHVGVVEDDADELTSGQCRIG